MYHWAINRLSWFPHFFAGKGFKIGWRLIDRSSKEVVEEFGNRDDSECIFCLSLSGELVTVGKHGGVREEICCTSGGEFGISSELQRGFLINPNFDNPFCRLLADMTSSTVFVDQNEIDC